MSRELAFTPGWRQRQMVASKEVSPTELVDVYLHRISDLDPKIHSYLTVASHQAMASARAAEEAVMRGDDLGPLHGVPIGVKDLEMTRGIRTTLGSYCFRDRVPDFDSVAVERLKAAGVVVLGKTNTPEFGMYPSTRNKVGEETLNPWDVTRTPGGSSGGSGAALAAGLCPIALGTDGGGSIRIPASFNHHFGIKVTQGRIPHWGDAEWGRHAANQFTGPGPMTRSVRDAAIMLQAMAGFDSRDPGSLRDPVPDYLSGLDAGVKGLRVGFSADLGFADVDPKVARLAQETARRLAEMGAHVEEAFLEVGDYVPAFWTIYPTNVYQMYADLWDERPDELSDYVQESMQIGSTATARQYSEATRYCADLRCRADGLMERFDLLVTPNTAVPAHVIGKPPETIDGKPAHPFWGINPFNIIWNITGQPAASVPAGFVDGLPVGCLIVGRRGEDGLVLRASAALEQARPWADEHPPVS